MHNHSTEKLLTNECDHNVEQGSYDLTSIKRYVDQSKAFVYP